MAKSDLDAFGIILFGAIIAVIAIAFAFSWATQ